VRPDLLFVVTRPEHDILQVTLALTLALILSLNLILALTLPRSIQ